MEDTRIRICIVVETSEDGLSGLLVNEIVNVEEREGPEENQTCLSFGMDDIETHLAIDRKHRLVDVRLPSVNSE